MQRVWLKMQLLRFIIPMLALFTFLTSCSGYTIVGYHQSLSSLGQALQSEGICIDFIDKDEQGIFTSALIYELEQRSLAVQPTQKNARFILNIRLLNESDENIGFAYAPQQSTDTVPRHFVVADEGRLSLSIRVQLKDTQTGLLIFDRCLPKEYISFDFEPDLGTKNCQQFALGQYEMHSEALQSARRVLYAQAAKAVVQQVYYDLM